MSQITRPFAVSASLSILLHGVVVAAALLAVNEPALINGRGIEIELVSSVDLVSQSETMVTSKLDVPTDQTEEVANEEAQAKVHHLQKQLVAMKSDSDILMTDTVDDKTEKLSTAEPLMVRDASSINDKAVDASVISQASHAIPQQDAILSLLHASISEKKEYPYIARRQRREGVATVSFVLHPDGTIADTHLLLSSSADTLDRAALSAVKRIQPFKPATQYLEQAETFKVDVVFSLL